MELEDFTDVGQIKWIQLDNTRMKIKVGVVYAPQESVTLKKELKRMYENIEEKVKEAEKEGSLLILIGDFNCKIGTYIEGNKATVTKGGRMLTNMAQCHNLEIVNATSKTDGLWTRVQGKENSVLDYVIVNKKTSEMVKSLQIDEERLYGMYWTNQESRKIYSDHNTMILEMNIEIQQKRNPLLMKMTRKSYNKYKESLQKTEISTMFDSMSEDF